MTYNQNIMTKAKYRRQVLEYLIYFLLEHLIHWYYSEW